MRNNYIQQKSSTQKIPKKETINFRTTRAIKQHAKEIVMRDETINNLSDLVNKALLNYFKLKYNISFDGKPYIDVKELKMINYFVPIDKRANLKELVIENHARVIQEVEEYRKKIFIEGREEDIQGSLKLESGNKTKKEK